MPSSSLRSSEFSSIRNDGRSRWNCTVDVRFSRALVSVSGLAVSYALMSSVALSCSA